MVRPRQLFIGILILTTGLAIQAQTAAPRILADADVDAAIRAGLDAQRVRDIGTHKTISRLALMRTVNSGLVDKSALVAGATTVWDWSSVGMTVYTPITWIQFHAAKAKAAYRSFSVGDVTPAMRESLVRVFIKPAIFNHAVIRSNDKKTVIQPISLNKCVDQMPFGNQVESFCQEFTFPADDFAAVRDSGGAFTITVIGTGYNRFNEKTSQAERDFVIEGSDLKRFVMP